jgi:anti-sigma factor RsiW
MDGRTPTLRVVEALEPTCRDLVELVTAYLDDALSDRDRAGFEAHLAHCRDCTVYLEQMRQTISELGELPPERLSAAGRAKLLSAFRSWVAG